VRDGDKAYAWRVKDGVLNKVSVSIGERDPRRGDFVVRSGLLNGDKVVSNPLSTLKDGQKVQMVASVPKNTRLQSHPAAASAAAGK
jgi:hypothetical protein